MSNSTWLLGQRAQAAQHEVRRQIPACREGDSWFHNDFVVAQSFVTSGSVRAVVEKKIGKFV